MGCVALIYSICLSLYLYVFNNCVSFCIYLVGKMGSGHSSEGMSFWRLYNEDNFGQYGVVDAEAMEYLVDCIPLERESRNVKRKMPNKFNKPSGEQGVVNPGDTSSLPKLLNLSRTEIEKLNRQENAPFHRIYEFCSTAFESPFFLCHISVPCNVLRRDQQFHPRMTHTTCGIVTGHQAWIAFRLKNEQNSPKDDVAKMLIKFLQNKEAFCCLPWKRTDKKLHKFSNECRYILDNQRPSNANKDFEQVLAKLRQGFDCCTNHSIGAIIKPLDLSKNERVELMLNFIANNLPTGIGPPCQPSEQIAEQALFVQLNDKVREWNRDLHKQMPAQVVQALRHIVSLIRQAHYLLTNPRKHQRDVPPNLLEELELLHRNLEHWPFELLEQNSDFWFKRTQNGQIDARHEVAVVINREMFSDFRDLYLCGYGIFWYFDDECTAAKVLTTNDVNGLRQLMTEKPHLFKPPKLPLSHIVEFDGHHFYNDTPQDWQKLPQGKVVVRLSRNNFPQVKRFHVPKFDICWVLTEDNVLDVFDGQGQHQDKTWLQSYCQDTVLFDGKYFVNGRWWNDAEVGKKVVVIVSEDTFHSVKRLHVPETDICWVLAQEAGVFRIVDEENKERDRKWLWRRFSTLIIDEKQFIDRRFWSEEELGQKLVIIVGKDKLRQVLRLYDKKFDICWVFDVCDEGVLEIFDEHGIPQTLDWIFEHLLIKTIMFIGQSGAGKSTLINGIPNYLKWPRFADTSAAEIEVVVPVKFDVQPPDDPFSNVTVRDGLADTNENFNEDGHSVTQHPRTYRHTLADGTPLRIIDTPGLSDTRGVTQDSRNLDLIREAIEAAGQVHAVCFVLDANKSRLTMELELALRDLLALFPQTVQSVVFFFFTYANSTFFAIGDTVKPLRQFLESVRVRHGTTLPLRPENHFCVDNETLRLLIAEKQNVVYSRRPAKDFEISWEKTTEAVGRFLGEVEKVQPLPTTEVTRVHELSTLVRRLQNYLAGSPRDSLAQLQSLADCLKELKQEMQEKTFVILPDPTPTHENAQVLEEAVQQYRLQWRNDLLTR